MHTLDSFSSNLGLGWVELNIITDPATHGAQKGHPWEQGPPDLNCGQKDPSQGTDARTRARG